MTFTVHILWNDGSKDEYVDVNQITENDNFIYLYMKKDIDSSFDLIESRIKIDSLKSIDIFECKEDE